jgi:hypothetical protein
LHAQAPVERGPVAPDPAQASAPQQDQHAEMLELVRQIERNLGRIDGDLGSAGAGEVPLAAPADSGIHELLRSTRAQMQTVVDDIDRIFAIREHHKSGGT